MEPTLLDFWGFKKANGNWVMLHKNVRLNYVRLVCDLLPKHVPLYQFKSSY